MNGIEPRVFVNDSSGSVLLNGMFAVSPPASSRRPNVWSMNCPQTKPHWVTLFSENKFWWTSLKTRLLTYRVDGPPTGFAIPSA
jgi:hypothetical protein